MSQNGSGYGQGDDPIEKWKKLKKHADKILDTTERHHRQAYDTAVEKHLIKDNLVDYEQLEDEEIQEKFANTMADVYIGKAKEYFKVDKELDDFQKELLLNAYAGETRTKLRQFVGTHGKKFKFPLFFQKKAEWMKGLEERLGDAASAHLSDKEIGKIISYTKTDNMVKKDYLTRERAIDILEKFEDAGVITPEYLKSLAKAEPYAVDKKYHAKHKRAA